MSNPSPLRPLIEAIDEPALLIDGTQVVIANRAAKALLGARAEGADVRLAIRHPHALERILAGKRADVEVTGIAGTERPWLVAIRPVERQLLLVRLHDRAELRAAEKMRVDFVANASHELRTPLSTILGYAETLAEDGDLEPGMREQFGAIIGGEAQRMLRIVEDLMSLSRIESERFVPPLGRISLAELAARAAARAQQLADSRRAQVHLEIPEDLPPVRGDEAQLTQLLDNLLANALRYGCPSSGCAVTVRAETTNGSILLTVSDDGEGIPAEHLPRLTERFYRVDEARSRDSGGTGLGLAIVKHIVERHRGALDIRSSRGRGTAVSISLPLA